MELPIGPLAAADQFGILALADISGYTAFSRMHITSLLHAEEIISELLEAVIGAARFPLQLGQLEGDAVLLYASVEPAQAAAAAHDVLRQMGRIFQAFTACERALIACEAGCVCDACTQIGQLRLKAVLHLGAFTLRQVQGVQELGGPEVKLLRQLIKAPLAAREYLLLTQPFYALSGPFENRYPDQPLPLPGLSSDEPALVYFPQLSASVSVTPGSGPAFSARLNKHSVARLLGRRRARFSNLPDRPIGPLSSVRYLLEGTRSGVNIVLRTLRGGRRPAPVLRQVVLGLLAIGWDTDWAAAQGGAHLDLDLLASALLTGVAGSLPPSLLLNKLEGDVALLYAPSAGDLPGVARAVAEQAAALTTAAWFALAQLAAQPGALSGLADAALGLRVRLLLHTGEVAIKHIQQREELAGSDVILIHRLLVAEAPSAASVLMTEAFARLAGVLQPPASLLMVQTADMDLVSLLAVEVPVPSSPARLHADRGADENEVSPHADRGARLG